MNIALIYELFFLLLIRDAIVKDDSKWGKKSLSIFADLNFNCLKYFPLV